MVKTWIYVIYNDSGYRHVLMVLTWIHGKGMDSLYIYGLMELTTLTVFSQTHGKVSVLLNHTHKR